VSLAGRRVHVRVPATTANLGPGFDTLGLALAFYDELEVEALDTPGVIVAVEGVGAGEVPTDETNLVASSIKYVFDQVKQPMPGLKLTAHNQIPHGRGMGSSGSAIVSGIKAAQGLLQGVIEFSDEDLLSLATALEGHPDNVAPALFGGLTIAWTTEAGPKFKKLSVHRGVSPMVLVPDFKMSTELARSLQPASVPHEDAVFNVSRSALLVAALTQSPELLFEATEDRLHQDYRASAMPETSAVITALRDAGFAAVVSGAGPSILVLCSDPAERLRAAEVARSVSKSSWRDLLLTVDIKGATVGAVVTS
jgi:homoserine kinase